MGKVFVAPIDVYFDPRNTRSRTSFFITAARLEIIATRKSRVRRNIVIEVLSPSTAYYDLKKRSEFSKAAGVPEYWIVDPIETASKYSRWKRRLCAGTRRRR
jgi:hypothetical protein